MRVHLSRQNFVHILTAAAYLCTHHATAFSSRVCFPCSSKDHATTFRPSKYLSRSTNLKLHGLSQPSDTLVAPKKGEVAVDLNWSFLQAVFVITCPKADGGYERISQTKGILKRMGISDTTSTIIKEFEADNEDRVRGCYTSHIEVLRDAKKLMQGSRSPTSKLVLVVEDNLALSSSAGSLTQDTVDTWFDFACKNQRRCDMIHLAYTPYVPNLTVSKTDNLNLVQLKCGLGSALGTSAYMISDNGVDALLQEHEEAGYSESIPDVMAKVFPETRFAAYPVPFQREAKMKSLVNPQLDDFRLLLLQSEVVAKAQQLLTVSGLSTNALLPIVSVLLLSISFLAGRTTLDAVSEFVWTGEYHGNILVPLLSSVFSLFSLGVIAAGIMLAPKPAESKDE